MKSKIHDLSFCELAKQYQKKYYNMSKRIISLLSLFFLFNSCTPDSDTYLFELLPIQSVGVMGDERTYEKVVALRAVSSTDGMTADWCHLPYEFLAKISNEIINKVKGVNRVVYDISSKPPATIEWE